MPGAPGQHGPGRRRDRPAAAGELPPQVYIDDRPAQRFERNHAWARTHDPDWVQDVVRLVALPVAAAIYRARPQHAERVPGCGPAILAPNHFSAMDHFFCGAFLRRRVRFMAKSQLFRGALGWVLQHGGAFPVRRGQRDEEAITTALSILSAGGVVVIYPEGGRSRTREIGERARPGVGRLALESGAPVVPVAIHGSMRVRNWRRLQFPRVSIRYGEAMRFEQVRSPTRQAQQQAADRVLAAVRGLYGQLSAEESAAMRPARPLHRHPAPR